MHLDIKKMKNLSTKALNDGLQFFIDLVSGEERKIIFRTLFLCLGNIVKKIVHSTFTRQLPIPGDFYV